MSEETPKLRKPSVRKAVLQAGVKPSTHKQETDAVPTTPSYSV